MVKASRNILWEVYISVSGQGGAPIGPSPLLKINKSPTALKSFCYVWLNIQSLNCILRNNCIDKLKNAINRQQTYHKEQFISGFLHCIWNMWVCVRVCYSQCMTEKRSKYFNWKNMNKQK